VRDWQRREFSQALRQALVQAFGAEHSGPLNSLARSCASGEPRVLRYETK
jgi:hypothetical protein